MSIEFRFVFAVLTCFRLAELIAVDHGPADIFDRFRDWCARTRASLGKFVACPWCTGLWFAAVLVWPVLFPTAIGDGLLIVGAIAGAQCFLENAGGRS